MKRFASRGQAFLALVILVGGVVLIAGVTIAFLTNSLIDTGYGYQASLQAEAAATSGAEDGLLQLTRNASFSSGGYSLPIGSTTATVSVTQNSPSTGFVTILSIATISNRTRKVNVVVSLNTSTTQTNIISWQDVQ